MHFADIEPHAIQHISYILGAKCEDCCYVIFIPPRWDINGEPHFGGLVFLIDMSNFTKTKFWLELKLGAALRTHSC